MGGFAGHMMHPYDNDNNTLNDLINIINKFRKNKDINLMEKLDGLNIFISYKNNKLTMARNKSDIKSGGFSYDDIMTRWNDKPNILSAYQFAYIKLSNILLNHDNDFLNNFFNKDNYQLWINCEVIHHNAPNVIYYDTDFISIHSVHAYDNNAVEIPHSKTERYQIYELFNEEHIKDNSVRLTKNHKLTVSLNVNYNDLFFKHNINQLTQLFNNYNLNKKSTIRDFKIQAFIDYCKITNTHNLYNLINTPDKELNEILINRFLFNDKSVNLIKIKSIIKNNPNINDTLINDLINITDKDLTTIKNIVITPLRNQFRFFGYHILRCCINYKNYPNDIAHFHCLRNRFTKLGFFKKYDRIPKQLPLEGIVFNYKHNKYKLTGYFPLYNDFLREK